MEAFYAELMSNDILQDDDTYVHIPPHPVQQLPEDITLLTCYHTLDADDDDIPSGKTTDVPRLINTDYFDYEDYLQKFIEGDGRVVCLAQIKPSLDGQLRLVVTLEPK